MPSTWGLVLLVVAVFVLELADARGRMVVLGAPESTLVRWGALSGELAAHEPWRVLSACFVHIGYAHVVFNLLALVSFGPALERHFGSARLFVAFVLAGVVGFLCSLWWYADRPDVLTAGASGGIFGFIGLYAGALAARRVPQWGSLLVLQVGYSFLFFFVFGTNQAAHLSGLAVGFALGWLLERERRGGPRERAWTAAAVLFALASVGSVLASTASEVWVPMREYELLLESAP